MDQNNTPNSCSGCGCKCHSAFPILIILFGLNFLLGQWGVYSADVVSTVWPILVIIAGVLKMTSRKCKCC